LWYGLTRTKTVDDEERAERCEFRRSEEEDAALTRQPPAPACHSRVSLAQDFIITIVIRDGDFFHDGVPKSS
jgi:hypothetical protein